MDLNYQDLSWEMIGNIMTVGFSNLIRYDKF